MSLMLLTLALAGGQLLAAPGPALERARVCWAAVDGECAEAALVEVRAELEQLAPADALDALRLSAEVALSADRGDAARAHIKTALERDPTFAPSWPAAWARVVDEVRQSLPDRLPPTLALDLPATVPPGKPLRVVVRASDPSGVASVAVTVKGTSHPCLTADGVVWQVELDRTLVKVPDLSLRVSATDRAGNVATATRVVPVALPPRPPEVEVPLTSRWWFWTAIGVGVAAVATGAVLIATSGDDAGTTARDTGQIGVLIDFSGAHP